MYACERCAFAVAKPRTQGKSKNGKQLQQREREGERRGGEENEEGRTMMARGQPMATAVKVLDGGVRGLV